MDIKPLYSTRFLPASLVAVLIFALAGCAATPEEVVVEEREVVEAPAAAVKPVEPVTVVLKPDYPEKYVVVKGDTLWDISARFLKDPWMWPRLWHFNPHIANPHLIYPGDILTIIFINGQPMMQVTRNGKVVTAPMELPAEVAGQPYPTVKLSPRIREQGLESAIPTISIDAIGPFLVRPRVVGEGELGQAPYVVAHDDDRMMSGSGYRIYTRGLSEQALQGDYVVVRAGQVYRNPRDQDEVLGYEAIYLGEARLTRFGDPSTMQVIDSAREILRGDRLIPKGDEVQQHSFTPRAPTQPVNGQIIAVLDGVNMISQYQVVVLDLGRQEDVVPGHVLAINQSGLKVRDVVSGDDGVVLPSERAGTVMIFRVFDRVSYALVMDATRTIRLHDQVTNP
ncbi:MAG: LysM peptidoglycan-binding domain-containing protein [Gammaproteobacteria bacterium]|nr:LysM peptidoglycan-binding domain-containing protein [Gammaproteobacteria bacterium]